MRIHILGICGTFMGGIALLARALGHHVTGADENIYPPMSTSLQEQGIEVISGFSPEQLSTEIDLVIIGNAMSRGNPCVEYILNNRIPYTSGPAWLHDEILQHRWVIAVSGTHGKTTTAGMLAWILEKCGYEPGFLIGGIPGNFNVSAKLGQSDFFVIEADEYDTAFFDKRSKFVHYAPRTLIMNNLEFDHADIFSSIQDIQKQFHHLVRIVPSEGKIFYPIMDMNLKAVINMGCWSEQESVGSDISWQTKKLTQDGSKFEISFEQQKLGEVNWSLVGEHNMQNGLMAIAAAKHVGVLPADAMKALTEFKNAKRRLEVYGHVHSIVIYDDFAHHPTAILATLTALRSKVGGVNRILAVLELGSNTMKKGTLRTEIAPALSRADVVFLYQPTDIEWSISEIAEQCIQPTFVNSDIGQLVADVVSQIRTGDTILVMSNKGFQGFNHKLLTQLKEMKIDENI